MSAQVFSATRCALGEGPLWHPLREQLFWFDILGKRMFCRGLGEGAEERHWQFDEYVSAAGWVDEDCLLMASASGLWRFDIDSGARDLLVPLEADNPVTRSNDGRADPWGGFWIGSMGLEAEPGAGAIYRYWKGELRQLVDRVTISNAICFAPDCSCAYYTDTARAQILRQPLDGDGWPEGEAEVFLDLAAEGLNPDGAVVDAAGNLWNAQWGAARVACYSPEGALLRQVDVPAGQASCPAFGGPDLQTLFVTTAAEGDADPAAGRTYAVATEARGQQEHQVLI